MWIDRPAHARAAVGARVPTGGAGSRGSTAKYDGTIQWMVRRRRTYRYITEESEYSAYL